MYSRFVLSTRLFAAMHNGICSGSFTLVCILLVSVKVFVGFIVLVCLLMVGNPWGATSVQQLTILIEGTPEHFKGAHGREMIELTYNGSVGCLRSACQAVRVLFLLLIIIMINYIMINYYYIILAIHNGQARAEGLSYVNCSPLSVCAKAMAFSC